jgi:hypothetical protein
MSKDTDLYTFQEAAKENKEDIASQRDAARTAIAQSPTIPKVPNQPTTSEEEVQSMIMALVNETLDDHDSKL